MAFVAVAVHANGDFVERSAQQPLTVLVGGGRRRPHPGQVVTEGKDRLGVARDAGAGLCMWRDKCDARSAPASEGAFSEASRAPSGRCAPKPPG